MPTDTSVQHTRPRNIKVTDPRYGTRTAKARRDAFHAERRAALVAEQEKVHARLESLRGDIARLMAKLDCGAITDPQEVEEAFAKLTRLGALERKFLDDIARITTKIAA